MSGIGAYKRTLMPGVTRFGSLFVFVNFDGRRLSISGVEGPLANGDCRGNAGQCIDSLVSIHTYSDGWDREKADKLRETWERWHLNDMRPGCEHQRATWGDTQRKVEVVSYKLTSEAHRLRESTRGAAATCALQGVSFTPTPTARALAELGDWYKARFTPPDADSPLSGCYEVEKREMKAIGWTYEKEHPEGVLGKPCETCGYKYGTQWQYEAVPLDVHEFLQSLPEATTRCPWREL